MSDEPLYTAERLLTIEQIEHCRAAAASFPGFVDFGTVDVQHGFFTHRDRLPSWHAIGDVELVDLSVEGFLSTKAEPWDSFNQVLTRSVTIRQMGQLRLLVGFEEKGSKQNKRAYDTVAMRVSGDRVSFEYYANGSQVMLGGPYAREFMARLIHELELPLTLEAVEDEFTLTHSSSGTLWLTGTLGGSGRNPTGFLCELPGRSPGDALQKIRHALQVFATTKRFVYSWSADRARFRDATLDPALSAQIYEAVVTAHLPAASYEVQVDFRLKDVPGIEAIRQMCGPKDEVFTRLCSFELPDDNWGELTIVTTAAGHRLDLALRLEEGLPVVAQRLGFSFRRGK